MASLALHLKSHHRHSQILQRTTISNLKFSHLFSSSSSSSDDENINKIDNHFSEIKSKLKQQSQEQSNLSPSPSSEDASTHSTSNNGGEKSYPFSFAISEIKSKLKPLEQQQHHHQFSKSAFGFSNVTQQGSSKPSTNDSIEKISQRISEFRRRSVPGSPSQQTSVFSKSNPDSNANNSFESIKQSLQNLCVKGKNMGDPKSLNDYGNNSLKPWRTKENDGNMNKMTGENLPMEIFGREISEKNMKKGEKEDGEFWMMKYEHHELGKKLKELRPNPKENKGNWFSLSELKERLNKVKENAEKGLSSLGGKGINSFGQMFTEALKETKNDSKSKMDPLIHGFNILDPPKFMLSPPKEHLVEKYFHPDNLSAKDKLKLELKKVRDEFKMHESDYGSSRVQIAQLTTEILHLSSVLHKKDKHSRRGLQAKVQQRKKLLKYLRRTDWESYCFVLSKLGLRDNPDYKN